MGSGGPGNWFSLRRLMDDAVVENMSVINISITSVLYGGQYLCEVQNAAGNSSAILVINGK